MKCGISIVFINNLRVKYETLKHDRKKLSLQSNQHRHPLRLMTPTYERLYYGSMGPGD